MPIDNDFLKHNLDFLKKIENFLEINYFHKTLIERIMNEIAKEIINNNLKNKYSIFLFLKAFLEKIIKPYDMQIDLRKKPTLMLIVGINGSGKTSTVAKMSNLLCELDYKTMIIDCDNFREAASDNLVHKTKQNKNIKIFHQSEEGDILKVLQKGYRYCIEQQYDVAIIDTSGRMSNNKNLMKEISNIKNFLSQFDKSYPNDVIFILDASSGHGILEQLKIFHTHLKITGIVVTKYDLCKANGIVFTVCKTFDIPVYGITNGSDLGSIKSFDIKSYIDSVCEPIREWIN